MMLDRQRIWNPGLNTGQNLDFKISGLLMPLLGAQF